VFDMPPGLTDRRMKGTPLPAGREASFRRHRAASARRHGRRARTWRDPTR
jgi:hypothetical protein